MGEAAYAAIESHVDRALAGERVGYDAEIEYREGQRAVHAEYVPDLAPDGRPFGALRYGHGPTPGPPSTRCRGHALARGMRGMD